MSSIWFFFLFKKRVQFLLCRDKKQSLKVFGTNKNFKNNINQPLIPVHYLASDTMVCVWRKNIERFISWQCLWKSNLKRPNFVDSVQQEILCPLGKSMSSLLGGGGEREYGMSQGIKSKEDDGFNRGMGHRRILKGSWKAQGLSWKPLATFEHMPNFLSRVVHTKKKIRIIWHYSLPPKNWRASLFANAFAA